ncbi:MAG: hypothetical protein GXO73_06145 [Calditrichaeota bacterium]|nr:hypothetical protein [Calditrichota bacterium]
MKTRWFNVLFGLVLVSLLVATGCQKKEAAQETGAKQPAAQTEVATQAETTRVAQPDTSAPEPPPGYKSIHQIQLEEHKQQEQKQKEQQ